MRRVVEREVGQVGAPVDHAVRQPFLLPRDAVIGLRRGRGPGGRPEPQRIHAWLSSAGKGFGQVHPHAMLETRHVPDGIPLCLDRHQVCEAGPV